jgi:hypothetical protein
LNPTVINIAEALNNGSMTVGYQEHDDATPVASIDLSGSQNQWNVQPYIPIGSEFLLANLSKCASLSFEECGFSETNPKANGNQLVNKAKGSWLQRNGRNNNILTDNKSKKRGRAVSSYETSSTKENAKSNVKTEKASLASLDPSDKQALVGDEDTFKQTPVVPFTPLSNLQDKSNNQNTVLLRDQEPLDSVTTIQCSSQGSTKENSNKSTYNRRPRAVSEATVIRNKISPESIMLLNNKWERESSVNEKVGNENEHCSYDIGKEIQVNKHANSVLIPSPIDKNMMFKDETIPKDKTCESIEMISSFLNIFTTTKDVAKSKNNKASKSATTYNLDTNDVKITPLQFSTDSLSCSNKIKNIEEEVNQALLEVTNALSTANTKFGTNQTDTNVEAKIGGTTILPKKETDFAIVQENSMPNFAQQEAFSNEFQISQQNTNITHKENLAGPQNKEKHTNLMVKPTITLDLHKMERDVDNEIKINYDRIDRTTYYDDRSKSQDQETLTQALAPIQTDTFRKEEQNTGMRVVHTAELSLATVSNMESAESITSGMKYLSAILNTR